MFKVILFLILIVLLVSGTDLNLVEERIQLIYQFAEPILWEIYYLWENYNAQNLA